MAARDGAQSILAVARSAPISVSELARAHYIEQLTLDDALRNAGSSWAAIAIDDIYLADLRAAAAGSLQDEQIEDLLGVLLRVGFEVHESLASRRRRSMTKAA